ncbi:MAG: thioredoxin family protein [Hyphomicrobiaceae bacterium]
MPKIKRETPAPPCFPNQCARVARSAQQILVFELTLLLFAFGAIFALIPKAAAAPVELDVTSLQAGSRATANLQLVVLEAPGCIYCNLFRRHVVPAYNTSPKSRDVPLKFIDLNDKAYDELGLDSPVDTVPTAVLLQNNREVGRIPGYMGPENFFHAINHLMARVQ